MNAIKRINVRKPLSLRVVSFLTALLFFNGRITAGLNTGADFLKIPIGAEPAGLGEAYTAMAHGINALNWNPAGMIRTPSLLDAPTLGISLSHQNQLSENNLDHVGIVIPAGKSKRTSWGLDLIRLSYASQEQRDESRQQTGTIGASDMALGAAFAHNFGRLQAGSQLKIIHMDLAGTHADGFAVDLGLMAQTSNPALSLGFAARNIGPRMQFVSDKFDLPLTLSVGTAYRIANPLTLAIDVHVKPHQKQTVLSIGTEVFASKNISLRAGYLAKIAEAVPNSQTSESNRGNFGGVSGLAAGFGLSFKQFSLDYSLTPFGELGNTQMLTLSTWFGETREQPADEFLTTEKSLTETSAPSERVIMIVPINNGKWWDSGQ